MRATGWFGKWEWKIAKGTISINRKARCSRIHGCGLNCTHSSKEWKASPCSGFTVSTNKYTSILHLHWFTCKRQKPTCSNCAAVACQPPLSQSRERFFFYAFAFLRWKKKCPTPQKKNDPTSKESKSDKRRKSWNQAELEQIAFHVKTVVGVAGGICSWLIWVLA